MGVNWANSLIDNTVTLSDGGGLYSKTLTAGNVNWHTPPEPGEALRLQVKTRYNQKNTAWASVTQAEDGRAAVVFDEPQRAVTRGQHAVFYDGDYVAGGGVIL